MIEITKEDIIKDAATEDNEMLLRRFVGMVGYDYVQHDKRNTSQIHPDFSEDTKIFWKEVEKRLNAPTTLNFDREQFLKRMDEEIKDQDYSVKHGQDYVKSYHAGIKSGLNIALSIADSCTTLNEKGDTDN